MPDHMRTEVFQVEGTIKGELFNLPVEVDIVGKMSSRSDEVAEQIERAVKKLMPPHVSVQASIRFEPGSLLVYGTVALLSWAGSIVFDVAKEEATRQLAGLIKMVVERVLSGALRQEASIFQVRSMEMSVSSSPGSLGSLVSGPPASIAPLPIDGQSATSRWLLIAVAVGLLYLLQGMTILDRFVEIRMRPTLPEVAAAPTNLGP
jgi:hypothetical protein